MNLDDDTRRALDRAEKAVGDTLGLAYPLEWLRPTDIERFGATSVKVSRIIEVAVFAALEVTDA